MKTKILIIAISFLLFSSPTFADNNANHDAVDTLNSLLKGELSAVETYKQALLKVGNDKGGESLKMNLADHEKAVVGLRKMVVNRGGVPASTSGAWGTWAETIVGSAKVIGDKTAMMALKEGEEHGSKEYNEALNSKHLTREEKQIILEGFLPNQIKHIDKLNLLTSE